MICVCDWTSFSPGSCRNKKKAREEERAACLVSSCVLSCLVLSCLVSCVLSCLLSCVLSCVLSCRVLSYLVLSCLVLSCLVLSCVLSCALSCLVLSSEGYTVILMVLEEDKKQKFDYVAAALLLVHCPYTWEVWFRVRV